MDHAKTVIKRLDKEVKVKKDGQWHEFALPVSPSFAMRRKHSMKHMVLPP